MRRQLLHYSDQPLRMLRLYDNVSMIDAFNRGTWAILGIGGLLVLGSLGQLAYRLTLPTDGWSYTSGAIGSAEEDSVTYATNLLGYPSPLQPGDYLLAVEGHPVRTLISNALALRPPLINDWQNRTSALYLVQRGNTTIELNVPLYHWSFPQVAGLAFGNTGLLIRLVDLAVGLFVLLKRPREPAARLLFLLATIWLSLEISSIVYWSLPEIVNPPVFVVAISFSNWIYGSLAAPTLTLLTLSFPHPKAFFQHYALLISLAMYGTLPLLVLLFGPQPFLGWGWTATCGMLGLLSVGHTLLTTSDLQHRAQLRWAGLGVFGVALNVVLGSSRGFGYYPTPLEQLIDLLNPVLSLLFPLTLAVAILRYRLFAIDFILHRALVYGTLTLGVVGFYIGAVTYLSTLIQSENNLLASLIATGMIAVAFQPLRDRLQQLVNRMLFGQRDEPYRVISSLGRQLEASTAPGDLFATIVETIGQTLKLPYVAITSDDEAQPRAVFQAIPNEPLPSQSQQIALNYHSVHVGTLLVVPRPGEGQFDPAEQRLLHDIARQIGIAVYAAQLTATMQRSRERIVTAREEERRRLRRDLHDGLGPHLASQTLTLDVIARLLRSDPDRAAQLLTAVREQVQQAVADIRDLIYGLRPPVLDDLGLYGALHELVEHLQQQPHAPQVFLHVPPVYRDEQPQQQLSAAVEVAIYRIAQEALTNVVKHAQASQCRVQLEQHAAQLVLDVCDNGVGIPPERLAGIGLHSMRERCEELGGHLMIEASASGGTRIRAVLPLALVEQQHEYQHFDG
jgi:signal transduction histidine kinase